MRNECRSFKEQMCCFLVNNMLSSKVFLQRWLSNFLTHIYKSGRDTLEEIQFEQDFINGVWFPSPSLRELIIYSTPETGPEHLHKRPIWSYTLSVLTSGMFWSIFNSLTMSKLG